MCFLLVYLRPADRRGSVESHSGAAQGGSGGERAGDGEEGTISP